jgi:hypothetical protein
MHIRFRITHVDLDGYNGRDFGPDKTDEGLIVKPVKMESWFSDNDDIYELVGDVTPAVADAANNHAIDGTVREDKPWLQQMWTCVTEDGRVLQLMDHEIELASAATYDTVQFNNEVK